MSETRSSASPITDGARAAWAAIDRTAIVREDLEIAGLRVRMELAGEDLAAIVRPALEIHPRTTWTDVDVVLRAYDSAATGAPLPRMGAEHAFRLAQWEDAGQTVRAAWQPDWGLALLADPGPGGVGHLAATAAATRLPWWEPGSPLRQLLAWAMQEHDRTFLHAAAVGSPEGVLLLAGAGGAGKSSTAVACLLAGLGYLADDYCILTSGPDGPMAHALYGTAKLLASQLAVVDPAGVLPRHEVRTDDGEDPKVTVVASRWAPEQVVHAAPIVAVAVASQAEPVGFERISAATALRHLAPTSVFQLAGHGAEDLRAIAGLVRRVPCYRLGLDPDLSHNPGAIQQLLRDAEDRPQ